MGKIYGFGSDVSIGVILVTMSWNIHTVFKFQLGSLVGLVKKMSD